MEVKLCAVSEFDDEGILKVCLPDREPLAVYQVDGQYFITEDTCSHGKASLSEEGELDGFVITCTWHDGQFDVRTGEALSMPCTKSIKSYSAIVKDGVVWVEIDD